MTQNYFEAIDATWSPLRIESSGPFRLRIGAGGGKRVSAASLHENEATEREIDAASSAMTALGQTPLFTIRPGQDDLDLRLENKGFTVVDPTIIYACPTASLAQHAPTGLAFIPSEQPLAAQLEIWADDGIGADRINVMRRSNDPKTYALARHADQIAGTAFVACHGDIAMLHALTIATRARRNGVGRNMTFGCAKWALSQGAKTFALITTQDNRPARALYESIGMTPASRYHYRIWSD